MRGVRTKNMRRENASLMNLIETALAILYLITLMTWPSGFFLNTHLANHQLTFLFLFYHAFKVLNKSTSGFPESLPLRELARFQTCRWSVLHIAKVHIILFVLIITICGVIYYLLFFCVSLILFEVFHEIPQYGWPALRSHGQLQIIGVIAHKLEIFLHI